MSWDVSIVDQWGNEVVDVRNVTFNNSKLFKVLGVHPDQFEFKECKWWVARLYCATYELEFYAEKYAQFEPDNKWGGIEDALDFLLKLREAAKNNPEHKVEWR